MTERRGVVTGENSARSAGLKKLAMDLGGNAPVIVLGDCNLDEAVQSCTSGAFWAAGQNCIGTQRLRVHAPIYDAFKRRFIEGRLALKVGDPTLPDTDVGPMISGREGVRFAFEEMTQPKVVCIRRAA